MLAAPYVPTMRLGQGFNTFTQGLCIQNAVTACGRPEAQEPWSRPPSPMTRMHASVTGGVESAGPTVSYCAKFVDRISELADALNISSPTLIKRDATRGTGGVAPLIDPARFHDSDVNFLVRVTVVARHVLEPSLTEFAPIDGVAPADFTRVYGDAFISGFAEGGEFTALVSVKLRGRATAEDVRARLAAIFDGAGGPGGGVPESADALGETTIAVVRTGGGDIEGTKTGDWTLTSLGQAVLAFPERVICGPVRISALLTEYTDLKSFHALTSKTGGPLDYSSAGACSSTLLDAYMDYKLILHDIAQATRAVSCGEGTLEPCNNTLQFADAARQAKGRYREQIDAYSKQAMQTHHDDDDDDDAFSTPATGASRDCKPPMPPNELVPYSADVFGLDKAVRDGQLEMLKIAREVDLLAADPDIAVDTGRYLNPAIFHMLLPTVENPGKEEAVKQAAEEAEKVVAAQIAAIEDLTSDLAQTRQKLGTAESTLNQLKPYDLLPAIGLNVPVKFKSASSGKVFDFNLQWASELFRQWNSERSNGNQKFKLTKAGVLGYYIVHVDSGRRVAANAPRATANGGTHLMLSPNFASVFVFEDAGDRGVRIRLADQPQYTVVVDGGKSGTDVVLWPQAGHESDRWYLEAFQ